MKVIIHDDHLGMIAENKPTGKSKFPVAVVEAFKRKLALIKAASNTSDLRALASLHFEKLVEKRYKDKYSIRLNKNYRLIFEINKDGSLEVLIIIEISNHYT